MNLNPHSLTVALPTSTFLPSLGGVEVGLHRIASGLLDMGCQPIIFTDPGHINACKAKGMILPYPLIPFPKRIFGILYRCPALGFYILDRFFAYYHKKLSIDIWHGTMGYPSGIALAHFASNRSNIPHLIRCCGEDIQIQDSIGYGLRLDKKIDMLVREWLPKSQSLVAITESVAEEYRALGISEKKIKFIPNGVDIHRFSLGQPREQTRQLLNIPLDYPMILSVGRNHPKKNYDILIHVAVELQKRGKKCCFVIVGLNATSLKPLANQYGVEEMFRLFEPLDDGAVHQEALLKLPSQNLINVYRAADIFLFPSLIETFGIVIVEAMAAGLPVIAGDSPGCRDVIRNGRDGLIVNPLDTNKIADAVEEILESSELQKLLSQRSNERAKDFDWSCVISKYLNHYKSLIRSCKKNNVI